MANKPPGLPLEVFALPMDDLAEAIGIWGAIQLLTEDEGSSVTVCAGNPDFNGQPNWCIDCCGEWTNWQETRFSDDRRLTCFTKALKAYTAWMKQP